MVCRSASISFFLDRCSLASHFQGSRVYMYLPGLFPLCPSCGCTVTRSHNKVDILGGNQGRKPTCRSSNTMVLLRQGERGNEEDFLYVAGGADRQVFSFIESGDDIKKNIVRVSLPQRK